MKPRRQHRSLGTGQGRALERGRELKLRCRDRNTHGQGNGDPKAEVQRDTSQPEQRRTELDLGKSSGLGGQRPGSGLGSATDWLCGCD